MNSGLQKYITKQLNIHHTALSVRFPGLRIIIKHYRILKRKIYRFFHPYSKTISNELLPFNIIRHQSPLMRTLGNSNIQLQYNKVHNLSLAKQKLNNIIINPGEGFSLWQLLGKTGYQQGYKDGMILIAGEVTQGPGGGLCQLANLLYWMFIHSDLTVIERYHHGLDVFPDSHRVLPFGSGATLVYNYRDLIVQNNTNNTYQIIISITDTYLKGQLRCNISLPYRYHIIEKDHCFINTPKGRWRYNQLRKQTKVDGKITHQELICTNCSPVLYEVNIETLEGYGYQIYNYSP